MTDKENNTLLLDIIQQVGALQGSVNILLIADTRAVDDRRELKVGLQLINGRVRLLESVRDQATGALWAARSIWVIGAGIVAFAVTWLAHKLGIT